ncbi:hypothetical protein Lal_00049566 [Lupinus albus]|uniref:Putative premnaspirodiene oxygenase n=1 Tax=Lupinus albus TaxID=3870 RepID=A0A6A4PKP8_LUPAL|nr:putative premnaspirodiene oxygenase [Lupinus albus]KAF1867138.1 hypothetical protein Lal_00049566 [Lupinus albus]
MEFVFYRDIVMHAMEIQPAASSFFLVLVILMYYCVGKIYKQKSKVVEKLPPGPWKLPIIGNLHQLAWESSLPHRALRDLANKYGPLMHFQLGEISALVVSSPHMAKQILKTHDIAFLQRPQTLASQILFYGSTNIALAPYTDYWRQMRKICILELLSAKRVQSFAFTRENEVAKLIHFIHFSQGSPLNLTKAVSSLTNTIISRVAFGQKSKHEDEVLFLIKKIPQLLGGFDLADLFPSLKPLHLITGLKTKLENVHKKLDKVLDNIVHEHQLRMRSSNHEARNEREKEDLVDVLLRVQQNGTLQIPLTLKNIKAVILDIFAAGTDTSAIVIEWAVSELMKNPRVREKVQAEIREAFKGKKTFYESDLDELRYLKSVIKETMRLHPPAPLLLPRECREPCKIGEYEIPIKTRVMVNVWALGRDSNHWYDANSFIPERFDDTNIDFKGNNFEFIPFGSGRRICPGISLALATVQLILAALLYHFDWELPNGMKPEDLDMTEVFGAGLVKKNNLCLIPTWYDAPLQDNVTAN